LSPAFRGYDAEEDLLGTSVVFVRDFILFRYNVEKMWRVWVSQKGFGEE
jgi:hypothetical protein